MPKFRDRLTGEIFEGNEDGSRITPAKKPDPNVKQSEPFSYGITDNTTLKAPTTADYFYNAVGRFIPPTLSAVGSIAGGLTPFPIIGSAAGGVIGTTAGKGLQALSPSLFGENESKTLGGNVQDVAVEAGLNLATDALTKGASKLIPSEAKRLALESFKSRFAPTVSKKALDALKADPTFDYSTGQTNSLAKFIEDTFASREKAKFVQTQEEKITKELGKHVVDVEAEVGTAKAAAEANVSALKHTKNLEYERFEPFIGANTKTVRVTTANAQKGPMGFGNAVPGSKIVKVEGAIQPTNSFNFAERVMKDVKKELGPNDINEAFLGEGTGRELKALRNELDKITSIQLHRDPITNQKMPERVVAFDQLKAIKDGINRFLRSDADEVLKGRLKGTLTALNANINKDLEEGVKSWGPSAYKAYRTAQDSYANLASKVNPDIAKTLLAAGESGEATYHEVARQAVSDPQKFRQFIDITQDRSTAGKIFMDHIVDNSFDAAADRFNPDKALQLLHDNKDVAKLAIPSTALSNFDRFLRRAQLVGPHTENANVGLKLRLATAGAALTIGTGTAISSGNITTGGLVGGSVILGTLAMNQFAKRVLLNPTLARIATEQLNTPPTTQAAKTGMKAILLGMKGMQVTFMAPDKREFNAEIGKDGKIKILGAKESQPSQALTATP